MERKTTGYKKEKRKGVGGRYKSMGVGQIKWNEIKGL